MNHATIRVTVLDDQPQTLTLMRDLLEPEGYVVSCTTRIGPELHEIRDTAPDLVVIDLLLASDQRVLSGWDVVVLARSHADLYRVPILVISGDHGRLREVSGEAAAMRDVHLLKKPFSVDDLLAAVTGALEAPSAKVLTDPGRADASEQPASAY